MDRQNSLATAETELSALQNHLGELAAAVSDAEARRAQLEQELVASQHRIDKAQARKEEVGLVVGDDACQSHMLLMGQATRGPVQWTRLVAIARRRILMHAPGCRAPMPP